MDGAISIIVVADRAIEKVIAENAIESFHLGSGSLRRPRRDGHPISNFGRAGPGESAVCFHHACVTRLNWAELWVIADVRNRSSCALDQIDEKFVGLRFSNNAVKIDFHHDVFLHATSSCKSWSRCPKSKNHNDRKELVSPG